MIDVKPLGGGRFAVRVREGESESLHEVTVSPDDLERLCRPGERPEELVRRAFEFLLAREPKESILSSFDLSVIGRYFPDFEEQIAGR